MIDKAKALIPVLIPLLISQFRRAEELATAMECRCYAVDRKRTKLVKLSFGILDLIAFLLMCLVLAGTILISKIAQWAALSGSIIDLLFYQL